jgi:hypothetical protein
MFTLPEISLQAILGIVAGRVFSRLLSDSTVLFIHNNLIVSPDVVGITSFNYGKQ